MQKDEYEQIYYLEKEFWWYKVLHSLIRRWVIKTKHSEDIKILDAGCGTGGLLDVLRDLGSVEGIDYSKEAIQFAKKRGLSCVAVDDLNKWVGQKNHYDIILCIDVIYHTSIEDDINILEKFYSALKSDGVLILNVPAFNLLRRSHDIVVSTKRRYRRRSLIRETEKIGFNTIFATYRHPFLFIIIIIQKLFSKLRMSKLHNSDLKPLPRIVNGFFHKVGLIENTILELKIPIPFGSSLFIVVNKK